MISKTLILGEMAVLFVGSLVKGHTDSPNGWTPVFLSKPVLKKAIAVTAMLAVLTFMADVGFGALAATFGGLVTLGYLIAFGAGLGQMIVQLESEVFS